MLRSCGVSINNSFTELLKLKGVFCRHRSLKSVMEKICLLEMEVVEDPFDVFEESPQFRRAPPIVRVDKMYEEIQSKLRSSFCVCFLSARTVNFTRPVEAQELVRVWSCDSVLVAHASQHQYLTNLLLKINAKLGGLNSVLAGELSPSLPVISKIPTLILGMDVSHGSPHLASLMFSIYCRSC
ncbi:hypothetical protein CASFOL_039017 [Castilleja foliolosa]|uniref:Piwi domain-containing protein n=1 Tax=Castilleja foliolosa TaxID=1961234 RepID=A0ABD3BHC5_9LAMI